MILSVAIGNCYQHSVGVKMVGSGFEDLDVGCLDTWVDVQEGAGHLAMALGLSPEGCFRKAKCESHLLHRPALFTRVSTQC